MKEKIAGTVTQAVKDLYQLKVDPALEHPKQESFGDYATAVALGIAQQKQVDPFEVANEIRLKIKDRLVGPVSRIDVVEPGFLNFWLTNDALVGAVNQVDKEREAYGSMGFGKGRTVVIDYSAPNIAKRFGVGHLRSTVIGQALYNLDKFSGYKVIGDNHIGDWGTQFGVLLYQVKSKKLNVKNLDVGKLEELYVEFHQEVDKDPKLMEKARAWFKKLEDGDKEARELWQSIVDISKEEFDRIYALLGIKFDETLGESFYEDKMLTVIKEVRKKGLSKKSEGAEIVEFENLPPAILVKSDGTTTYFTRDLATIKFRIEKWDPQFITYEVGADQKLHFQQVFETAKKLGWGDKCYFFHVPHGLIRFAGGKMSTRRGQTVRLEDILKEAVVRAKKLTGANESIARMVGIGSVKYFDLSHQPQTDIIFDWEKMFLMEGNSAPYLQYTYARAESVLQKAGRFSLPKQTEVGEEEQPLLRYIYRFPEAVEVAAGSYSPNLICNYLFELAQRFNSFYDKAPIIKADEKIRPLRLLLTSAVGQVVKNGLTILGIETPERL